MVGVNFKGWLSFQEANLVDRSVLDSYERAFRHGLDGLIARTKDPELRKTFEGMRHCPVHDGSGACRTWTDYVVGALIRHCAAKNADIDEVLQTVVFHMLSKKGEKGQPRKSIFDFNEDQPFDLRLGNPLEVLFKTYLRHSLATLCNDRLRRIRIVDRPTGTVTIAQGRAKNEPTTGTVSADEIPDKSKPHERELFQDIADVLRRRSTPALPLAALWDAMLAGMPLKKQRATFGHTKADTMRRTIKAALWDYAVKSHNDQLLQLLDRFADYNPTRPDPNSRRRRKAPPKPKPKYPPDVQDYLSILDVIEKAGGAASMAILGKKRRRWLERKPRNSNSPHKTRLHDVLARMVNDGVLVKRGSLYAQGPNFHPFKAKAATMTAAHG